MTCFYARPVNYIVPELKTLAKESLTLLVESYPELLQSKSSKSPYHNPLFVQDIDSLSSIIRRMLTVDRSTCVDNNPKISSSPQMQRASLNTLSNMKLEENRLKSFQNRWPLQHIEPSDLAAVGLFYLGAGDKVQCAFCHGIIADWEEGDKPLQEHINHFPMCPFLLNCDVGNVPISGSNGSQQWQMHHVMPEVSPTAVQNPQRFKPKHPTMGSFDKRLETFQNWPAQWCSLTPAQLAESGLFYSGVADVVTCFCCGGSLGNWNPEDDAWTEHAKHYPSCAYVKCIKGSQFLVSVQQTNGMITSYCQTVEEPSPSSSVCQQSQSAAHAVQGENVTVQTNISEETVTVAASANCPSQQQANHTCKICMEEDVNRVAFLPCGHSLACPKCASILKTCPICRRKIESVIKIYFD